MRIELGIARGNKNRDRKLALVRKATTAASAAYGIGGRKKTRGGPKPVTLPKVVLKDADPS